MEMEKTMGVPKPEGSGTEQYLEEMQRIFCGKGRDLPEAETRV